jgi:serine/threonine-protein kinase
MCIELFSRTTHHAPRTTEYAPRNESEQRDMPNENQRIGEYVLEAKVGGGTFGEVWRAHHHIWTDQLVAVKIPTNPQYLRDLQREGCAIHGLVHPNIVRATGFDPYAQTPYLTMEYIPGTSLRPLIQKRSLTITDAVAVLRQVLAGLAYAHANGLVHRDVKPENILIHERAFTEGFAAEGVVKVTDFGFGQAAAHASAGSIVYSASLAGDAGREIAGSLDYMAPEQRAGGTVDARADLYACGVILYELLTGEKPAGIDVPGDLNKAVPKALDEVFRRSYARLEKRFASADDFTRALAVIPPPVPRANGIASVSQPPLKRIVPLSHGPAFTHEPRSGTVSCPRCHQSVAGTDQFCMHCGVQMVTTVRRCRQCGAYPDASDRYCIFCGEGLVPEPGVVSARGGVVHHGDTEARR